MGVGWFLSFLNRCVFTSWFFISSECLLFPRHAAPDDFYPRRDATIDSVRARRFTLTRRHSNREILVSIQIESSSHIKDAFKVSPKNKTDWEKRFMFAECKLGLSHCGREGPEVCTGKGRGGRWVRSGCPSIDLC